MDFNVRIISCDTLAQARAALAEIGADAAGIKLMAPKSLFRILKVEGLSAPGANIVKQHMLSVGGEAAVHRDVIKCGIAQSEILLMGTNRQYRELVKKLKIQPFRLKSLAGEIQAVLAALESRSRRQLHCRNQILTLGERTLVMGILNVTPDSFSDGGLFNRLEQAVARARQMVEEGADIIDVGGESTRPSSSPVPAEEELRRLLPVLERLVAELAVPISVDTSKAQVAHAALSRGAHMLNDVWGFKRDPDIARVCSDFGVPAILMHNQRGTAYKDLMGDVIRALRESAGLALAAGVAPDQIIVDPGIGFGKDTAQNLEVMSRLKELRSLGYPVLLGTSRKSMIGNTLNLPVTERLEGTAATVALGIASGADIIRVHDVKAMVRVARMSDAIVRRPASG